MILDEWARKWSIPISAIKDLKKSLCIDFDQNISRSSLSEAGVQNLVRLEASEKGCRLWRNNVGATYTSEGHFIRYGLANDSSGVNRQIKSADLIGIRPVKITEAMIGLTIGQFLSREIKSAGWRYTGNAREQAQLAWAELILSLGGDACFVTGEGTI